MKPYRTLTERGQARRLQPLAWNALQQYDLDVARLRLVTNDLNGIFRLDTSRGEKYILRVTLPEGWAYPRSRDRRNALAESPGP